MKRRTRFIIAFAAAAITFGSLTAFMGPRNIGMHDKHHGHCGWHCDGDSNKKNGQLPAAQNPADKQPQ